MSGDTGLGLGSIHLTHLEVSPSRIPVRITSSSRCRVRRLLEGEYACRSPGCDTGHQKRTTVTFPLPSLRLLPRTQNLASARFVQSGSKISFRFVRPRYLVYLRSPCHLSVYTRMYTYVVLFLVTFIFLDLVIFTGFFCFVRFLHFSRFRFSFSYLILYISLCISLIHLWLKRKGEPALNFQEITYVKTARGKPNKLKLNDVASSPS